MTGYSECAENNCNDLHRNKNLTKCSKCRQYFCFRHIGSRPDESNIAITNNALLYCSKCYKETYD